jgi:hypothetical protein
MKKTFLKVVYLYLILTLLGCAFGRNVPYETMKVDLNYSGTNSIALAVYDQREMVVDGSRKADFVGYTRSGAGIAYPMGTANGQPFAQIIQETISHSLEAKGYTVINVSSTPFDYHETMKSKLLGMNCDKLLMVRLNKLHSDFYAATIFYSNVDIEIFDGEGKLVFEKNYSEEQNIGGSAWGTGKYQEYCPEYLADRIGVWLNDEEAVQYFK